jgi:hypothetical protein
MPFDYNLLASVRRQMGTQQKRAFVPSPQMEQQMGQQMGQQGQQGQQEPQQAPQQGGPQVGDLVKIFTDGIQQGAKPEEIIQAMASKGVPKQVLEQVVAQAQQAMGGQTPGPTDGGGDPNAAGGDPNAPQEDPAAAPPIDLQAEMQNAIKSERERIKALNSPPEERIMALEKKVEILTNILQDMIGGLPQKEASLHNDELPHNYGNQAVDVTYLNSLLAAVKVA